MKYGIATFGCNRGARFRLAGDRRADAHSGQPGESSGPQSATGLSQGEFDERSEALQAMGIEVVIGDFASYTSLLAVASHS
jgi:hypothetical protein